MSNINRKRNNFRIELDYCQFYDLQLDDDILECYNCDELISGDTVVYMEFNSAIGSCNFVDWEDAIATDYDYCNIGLNGYDNRFVQNFTGESINFSGITTFCVYPVSGDIFCYHLSGTSDDYVDYVQFCGGFFQGFYKFEDYDYQTLPNEFLDGWTKEFWIKRENCPSGEVIITTGMTVEEELIDGVLVETSTTYQEERLSDACHNKFKLNDVFPNNTGIFYFWGAKSSNKFCNFINYSGLTTCEGVPLGDSFDIEQEDIPENGFLYYNEQLYCSGENLETFIEYDDCCEDIIDNALAFKSNDDGSISIRYISTSGECVTTGETSQFENTPILSEFTTKSGLLELDKWHHVVFRFKPDNNSECNRTGFGELNVYVDGFLADSYKDFKEFIPRGLDEDKEKQLAVPYNLSIGGGTQGLLESYIFSGDTSGVTICDYSFRLRQCFDFKGISIDGIEYRSEVYLKTFEEVVNWLNLNLNSSYGKATFTYEPFTADRAAIIYIEGFEKSIDYIITECGRICVNKDKCANLQQAPNDCTFLEENFAGSFIGGIAEFRFHDRPLCYHEIKCNFDIQKEKYNRHKDKFIC